MSKTYFITIPKTLVETIRKELNLKNPPQEAIQVVSVWCVSQMLSSNCLNDYVLTLKDPQKILEILKEESLGDIAELEAEK